MAWGSPVDRAAPGPVAQTTDLIMDEKPKYRMCLPDYLDLFTGAIGLGMFAYGASTDQTPWVLGGWLLGMGSTVFLTVRKGLKTGEWPRFTGDDGDGGGD